MSTLVPTLWAALAAAACASGSAAPDGGGRGARGTSGHAPELLQRRLVAMGTHLEVAVEARDRTTALAASERAVRAIEAVEARLSTWRPDSELARLNATPVGVALSVSPALASDLARARALRAATGGAFDPGIGRLVDAWGLRTGGRRPEHGEIEAALEVGGLEALELVDGSALRRHDGLVIEEGGFGKGVGLDAALAALAGPGVVAATLDLGGQIALLGREPRSFVLADPCDRDRPLCRVTIDGGSLATSANSERGIEVDGVRRSHILDPRTGEPAPDFGSLTVWTGDATTADALSTGLYVMGPDAALSWASAREGVEVLVADTTAGEPRLRATAGWRGRLAPLADGLLIDLLAGRNERESSP